jgi:phenylacetate-coenzyme A ligase PaaK-like adenylate-forming protein
MPMRDEAEEGCARSSSSGRQIPNQFLSCKNYGLLCWFSATSGTSGPPYLHPRHLIDLLAYNHLTRSIAIAARLRQTQVARYLGNAHAPGHDDESVDGIQRRPAH